MHRQGDCSLRRRYGRPCDGVTVPLRAWFIGSVPAPSIGVAPRPGIATAAPHATFEARQYMSYTGKHGVVAMPSPARPLARLLLEPMRCRLRRHCEPAIKIVSRLKPTPLSTAIGLLSAVLLASAMVAPAAAATRYIGLIGLSGATAAPSADIGERLQRINMLGYDSGYASQYGTAVLAGGPPLLGSIGTAPAYGNGRGGFAFEGAGLGGAGAAGLRTASPTMDPAPPVSGLPSSGQSASLIMLVAGLGLMAMIARRRTVLR